MNFGAKLTGLAEVDRTLARMPNRMQTQVVKVGLRGAAKRPIKYARQEIRRRSDTGTLAKSIGSTMRTYRRTGISVMVIGPRKGFINPKSGAPANRYGLAVEYGWLGQDPDPFLHRTLNAADRTVLGDFQTAIMNRLDLLVGQGKISG